MAVTSLDLQTALVVIDLQKGIAAMPVAHPIADVVKNTRVLLDAFRSHGLPVVLVNVAGVAPGRAEQAIGGALPPDFAELLPELDVQPTDHLVTKRTWGAFTGTDLESWLKAAGVTQIVLCGVATSIGVESTARFASELGYNVTLAIDAMSDLKIEAHDNTIAHIFPRLGERGTAQEIAALLESRE
jgi:nicotinamidase-related amidase